MPAHHVREGLVEARRRCQIWNWSHGGCEPPCDVGAGNGTCSLEEQSSHLSSCLPSSPQHIHTHTFPYLGKFSKTKVLNVEVKFCFPSVVFFSLL